MAHLSRSGLLLCVVLALALLAAPGITVGQGRGGGPKHSFRGGGRGGHAGAIRDVPAFDRARGNGRAIRDMGRAIRGEGHPHAKQLLVEERKLAHRKEIAEHLRQTGERNGNEQLSEVADRMEERAQEHYEKRLSKIHDEQLPDDAFNDDGPLDGLDDVTDENAAHDALEDLPGDAADVLDRLHGRENALTRQLLNEERKLEHQLQQAERLRQLADANGNGNLLDTADRMADRALTHYEQRVAKITQFQDTLIDPVVSGE